MRHRALVHVAGPAGAGKTTFIERLLDARVALAICVRAQRDNTLSKEQESAPKTHVELRRYREAGASAVALYRFAEASMDGFYETTVMHNYSSAVFIEGDCPVDHVDLAVFVAPPLAAGGSLVRRVFRSRRDARLDSIEHIAGPLARLLGAGLGGPFGSRGPGEQHVPDDLRHVMELKLNELRRAAPPPPTEHWALAEGYEGIERAQLIVVNVRSDTERAAADHMAADIARLRKDPAIFDDVIGYRGNKLPITVVVADLTDPKDAGLKKAVARVKRAAKQQSR